MERSPTPIAQISYRERTLSRHVLGGLVFVFELCCIVFTSINAGVIYHLVVYQNTGSPYEFLSIGYIAAAVYTLPSLWRGDYSLTRLYSRIPNFKRAFYGWNATFIFLLVLGFSLKITEGYSRGWLITFYFLGYPAIFLARLASHHVIGAAIRRGLVEPQRLFLVGSNEALKDLFQRYQPWLFGQRIIGCVAISDTEVRPEEIDKSVDTARALDPDSVLIVAPWADRAFIQTCVEQFSSLPAATHLAPGYILQRYRSSKISQLGDIPSLRIHSRPLSSFDRVVKRTMDLLIGVIALLITSPLLVAIAIMIKLDSKGPVLFRQRRHGFNQDTFLIYKFRTMTAQDDGPIVKQATKHDPRLTRIGRHLRSLNLDEIPQLWNVLRGEMSLVGPRPHALAHNHEYALKIQNYARRHNVKPGITGWAQVNGYRGITDTDDKMRDRVEYDLYYIDNWSLWLDLQILFMTVASRSVHKNAY